MMSTGMVTERYEQLQLDVWRAAWRGIAIQESIGAIAALLEKHIPLAALLIRRLDAAQLALETVAVGLPAPGPFHATRRSSCTPAQWKRLLTWAERGSVVHGRDRRGAGELALIVPAEIEEEVLVGSLLGPQGPAGVALVVAPHRRSFRPLDESLFRALLEPLSAALEMDRLIHELQARGNESEVERAVSLRASATSEIRETIVGAESGLRNVMERVELVASSDVPVLILGDTGTGKEVVSRAIHGRSPRAAGPFIRVNCGAIPQELIDSQLFGHEKGSFTGAADTRSGWFERADGGTLFLDEIGELPLPAQVRLLRVLQDGYIERVGGQQPIRVDVRIVAATHRDLAAMVQAGTFREDLWYRINVFPILLPRLCERPEDIPALARHFAERAARRFGLAYVEPSPSDLQLLISYSWPGNIRELGAVIDRAAILGEGKCLEVAKSLGWSRPAPPPPSSEPTIYEVIPDVTQPLVLPPAPVPSEITSLEAAMKQHIERALLATRGRIEGKHGTAALLRINPHTLRARMRKLGIRWDEFRSDRAP